MSNDKYCHENKQPIARLFNEKCAGNLIIEYFPRIFLNSLSKGKTITSLFENVQIYKKNRGV